MLLPLFEQLLQQAHHLLYLFRCERPVFGPLHATVFIQHHYSGTFFIQLPGTARDAIAIDNKLRPGIKLLLLSRLLRTNMPEPGIASSVLTMVVVW